MQEIKKINLSLVLNDVAKFISSKIEVSEINVSNYISTENMLPNKGGITTASSLPDTKSVREYIPKDILINNIRPYFKKIWYSDMEGGCSNDIYVLRSNENYDSKFLYYVLSSDDFFSYVMANAKGTKMPRGDKKAIQNYKVPNFSIDKQKKISSFLGEIDRKIEINKKLNKNLTICIDVNFKNNLLNFNQYSEQELVSSELGLIPKEWEVSNLTNIANYQNGLAMQKFPPENDADCFKVLKIKELRQGFFDETSDSCSKNIKEECIVYDGDVIFSWSGSLLVDIWTGGTCGLNQHLFKVTSSKFDKWFYYCWTKFYLDQFILIAKDKATTMGHIKRKHLDESLVLIPDKETYSKLTMLFKPLFDMLIKNKIEIKKLQNLRDVLMPKLMSGEVDVSKINCDLKIIIRKIYIKSSKLFLWRYLSENQNYIKNTKSNETLLKSRTIHKINKFLAKFNARYRYYRQ